MSDDNDLPPAKKAKIQDDTCYAQGSQNYGLPVISEEIAKLREFQVLDEVKSDDEDSNDGGSEKSSSSDELPEEEIEKMLDEDLPEDFKGVPKPKEKKYVKRQKIVLEEKGINYFEVLPLDWMMVRHCSGMPVYMHRASRVCTLSKPYFLGKGNTRRHDIPISAIPCLAYRIALKEEKKQMEIDKKIADQIRNGTWTDHNKPITKETDENDENHEENDVGDASQNGDSQGCDTVGQKSEFSNGMDIPKCPFNKNLSKSHQNSKDSNDNAGLINNENSQDANMDNNVSGTSSHSEEIGQNSQVSQNGDSQDCDMVDQKSEYTHGMDIGKCPFNKKLSKSKQNGGGSNDNATLSKSENSQDANMDDNVFGTSMFGEKNGQNIQDLFKLGVENVNKNDKNASCALNENDYHSQNENDQNSQHASIPIAKIKPLIFGEDNSQSHLDSVAARPVVLPGGQVMPPPRVETVSTSWKSQQLSAEELYAYCKRLFKFKEVNIMHFKRWADRRKYTKARKTMQYPALPEGTKLITIPAQDSGDPNGGGKTAKRDWVMNMNSCSYLSVFHEYVRRALHKQPVYQFKQLENATAPYQATVYIGGMQYGVGRGSSKRQAKSQAARASIHILIPEMRDELPTGPADLRLSKGDPDFTFFDYVTIEDPRIQEFCGAAAEPSPHAILRTCLLRNFGVGDRHIYIDMKKLEFQKIELTMRVGKHSASVVCKNKKQAKQRASQHILQVSQLLHPHITSWGSLLRLYGSRSMKSCKEKKMEEQQITLLQDKAQHNEPNFAVLDKLRKEMTRLKDRDGAVVSIGTLIVSDDLPTHSGSNLNNVEL